MARAQWEYDAANPHHPWRGHDGKLTVTQHDDGSVLLEIEQEQAVDSYNANLTCAALLPAHAATALTNFLAKEDFE